jgi:hypothetical protein
MSGKSAFFALAFWICSIGLVPAIAQDAGVSGIPHGPGSIGGVNNSINDPSGIGNAAKVPPPPAPHIAAPVVPNAAPVFSSRLSSRSAPTVRRVYGRTASLSRREFRRTSARAAIRTQDKLLDQKMSICKGC